MIDRATLAVVAAGGATGAAARYGLGLAWPEPPGTTFPWTTFAINVCGCLGLAALVGVLELLTSPHRLVRPLVGTGFLGGFTTFSTYAEQTRALLVAGRWATALVYFVGTLVVALSASWLGTLTVAVAARQRRKS